MAQELVLGEIRHTVRALAETLQQAVLAAQDPARSHARQVEATGGDVRRQVFARQRQHEATGSARADTTREQSNSRDLAAMFATSGRCDRLCHRWHARIKVPRMEEQGDTLGAKTFLAPRLTMIYYRYILYIRASSIFTRF